MADEQWKLKPDAEFTPDQVAKIACALKSLAVYTSMACDRDDNPDELQKLVEEGLEAVERIFQV